MVAAATEIRNKKNSLERDFIFTYRKKSSALSKVYANRSCFGRRGDRIKSSKKRRSLHKFLPFFGSAFYDL